MRAARRSVGAQSSCAVHDPLLTSLRMRRIVFVLFFLVFTTEGPMMYAGLWKTHMHFVDVLLFEQSPLKLPLFFFIQIGLLIVAASSAGAKGKRAAPMDRALTLSLVSVVVWTFLGASRGGKPWMAGWQLYCFVSAALFAKLLIATMKTPKHFESIGKIIMAAALYRSVMAIIFWYFFFHNVYYEKGPPAYMTTHDDTVLFVTGLVLAINNAVVRRTKKAVRFAIFSAMLILPAIQFNNRRLAWASLGFSLVVVYAFLPRGKVKRKINWGLVGVSPVVLTYVVAGWGRPEAIFKPLRSFSTMTTEEDASTLARNAENKGLLATLTRGSWISGTGWGQEYVEIDSTFSIAAYYKEWRYVPHNSIIGALAFTGVIGFSCLWLVFPVSVFLNSRTWRIAQNPTERIASLTAITQVVICSNQMFGDMGLQSPTTLFMAASGFAVAGRLSASSGAWPDKKARRIRAAS
jgi:hypothetical protein